eukprot:CAMPEP_0203801414 /NCGR_PEP_ID=MMETSP0100_2-20121128/11283_1 /ASSEMBLY_ACC=CAM_ASM_000210 /TAXON_ID=96639 /ORGANISM=" , Strain NY0313808BC1" /LENGTH=30 /DNA_ID= /DNA_START= /DNA_END= /DNA_ORIENTATION=
MNDVHVPLRPSLTFFKPTAQANYASLKELG